MVSGVVSIVTADCTIKYMNMNFKLYPTEYRKIGMNIPKIPFTKVNIVVKMYKLLNSP